MASPPLRRISRLASAMCLHVVTAPGVAAAAAGGIAGPDIRHVVLLMMENRPFDHYFGWARRDLWPPGTTIDGLTGSESNPYNVSDPSAGGETVQAGRARYVCQKGAKMSFSVYRSDFYGPGGWDGSRGCPPGPTAPMDGFLQENEGWADVMWQFSPDQIPVKMALAREFALFDRYFSSCPTPSTPNHLMLQTGTAAGCTETDATYRCRPGKGINTTFPQRTIYESLDDANRTWAYYYNDTAWNGFMRYFHTKRGRAGIRPYSDFYDRAANGTLPSFSFVAPRQGTNRTTGQGPNDDHPCHDVALGERLIKDTYEALRAGPGWNHTVLLIVWDDGGGWYDHVPPPCGVPAPDDETGCPDPFDFTRLGARVPLLLASPWVPRGTVVHGPRGPPGTPARPAANSEYDHTSVLATLKNLYGLPSFLTRRDAWAGSFHLELSEPEPRTDCPMHLPDPPRPAVGNAAAWATHGAVPPIELTRRQRRRLGRFVSMRSDDDDDVVGEVPAAALESPGAAEVWLEERWRETLERSTEDEEL